jgi:transmembrane sensor
MDDLILRSLQGRAGDLEARILRKWREESPANEAHYRQLARVWHLESRGLPDGAPPSLPSLERVIGAAEARRAASGGGPGPGRPHPRFRGWRRPLAGVAMAALAAAAGLMLVVGLPETDPTDVAPSRSFAAAEFTTGSNQSVTVNLNDGSYVRLAPYSRLQVTAEDGVREVWLEGRGYFAVASDPDRPFTVRTRMGDALVIGTRFEVDVRDENLRLVVTEGHVALSTGSERVDVRAGDVIHLAGSGTPVVEQVEDVHQFLDWPKGLLVFHSTPLEQVARELGDHFGIPFEISGPGVADRKVTGWFDDETLEEVLSAVCRATDTRCVTNGGVVRMTPGADP